MIYWRASLPLAFMRRGEVHQTLSPAMDIQVASNFERFLYYHFDQDSDRLVAFMQEFTATGSASIGAPPNISIDVQRGG